MKKAIIFDLDNTLIMWKKEFIFALRNVIKEMNLIVSEEIITKIDIAFTDLEINLSSLSKEKLLNYVNEKCNLDLKIDFIDNVIDAQGECFYIDKEIEDILNYLSQKYDLYVITNWFTKTQKKRLENMNILKYFKDVYGADINYLKPNKKSFDVILEKYDVKNLISIGDTLENDVLLPISLGMDAYWLTNKETEEVKTIKSLIELKQLL